MRGVLINRHRYEAKPAAIAARMFILRTRRTFEAFIYRAFHHASCVSSVIRENNGRTLLR